MAALKTKPTPQSVDDFIGKVADEKIRDDCYEIIELMTKITGEKPKMWGPSIIGFGQYHYRYDSGHEGDMCITGFSPRKPNITIYVIPGIEDHPELLNKLGKFKVSKACLYIKRLSDVDKKALEALIRASVNYIKKKYPAK